jgi:hypothetical protein
LAASLLDVIGSVLPTERFLLILLIVALALSSPELRDVSWRDHFLFYRFKGLWRD